MLIAEHAPDSWADQVYAINPMSVARYREGHFTSGAKSDAGDAHVLVEIVRLDRDHHRRVLGTAGQVLRLRSTLQEFFPAALTVFDDLTRTDALELLQRAPDPDHVAELSRAKIAAALRRAQRRNVDAKAAAIQAGLRAEQLRQAAMVEGPARYRLSSSSAA